MSEQKLETAQRLNALIGAEVKWKGQTIQISSWESREDGVAVEVKGLISQGIETGRPIKITVGSGEVESTVGMWERQLVRSGLDGLQNTPQEEAATAVEDKLEDRNFIVFYTATVMRRPNAQAVLMSKSPQEANRPKMSQAQGDVAIKTPGHYISKAQVQDFVKRRIEAGAGKEAEVVGVTITNIVELSDADMLIWELPLQSNETAQAR